MGGQTSKTFKLRGKHKKHTEEGENRTSVTGVQYRDKEFQLARETQSAYYYDHKNDLTEGANNSDTTTVQKRVVLQRAGGSDHTLFKRVRETPTAVYYEPNETNDVVETVDDTEKLEKKNIVLENAPTVEEQIKVIRGGSSDIVIRPHGIHSDTTDKDQSEDDKGLTTIAERQEHEGKLSSEIKGETVIADEQNEQRDDNYDKTGEQNEKPDAQHEKTDTQHEQPDVQHVQREEQHDKSDEQHEQPHKQHEQLDEQHKQLEEQQEQSNTASEDKEEECVDKEAATETKTDEYTDTGSEIKEMDGHIHASVSEELSTALSNNVDINITGNSKVSASDEQNNASTKDQPIKIGEDTNESETMEDKHEDEELAAEEKNNVADAESKKLEKLSENDSNEPQKLETLTPVVRDAIELGSLSGQESRKEPSVHEEDHIEDNGTNEENSIIDKETGATVKEAEHVDT